MAADAKLLGRHKTPCLGCDFRAPHVKQKDGKHPYIHCPNCGLTIAARNGQQAAGILAGTRTELHELPRRPDDINVAPPTAAAAPAAATPPASPAPAAVPAVPAPKARLSTLLG